MNGSKVRLNYRVIEGIYVYVCGEVKFGVMLGSNWLQIKIHFGKFSILELIFISIT